MAFFKFTRQELKHKSARQFKEGDTVKCGKYYIHIRYGPYDTPSLMTRISTETDLRDLYLHKWPYYIRYFVSRGLDEVPPLS